MGDRVSEATRSYIMSSVGSKNTGPEIALRRALWHAGFRYRIHYDLPGKPDLAFPSKRVAVFVDGCFWHGCPDHGSIPSTNAEYWQKKFRRNRRRDRDVEAELARRGWKVVRVWEHSVRGEPRDVVERIAAVIESASSAS